MLFAQLVDRVGSGIWTASAVLFFTFVAGLGTERLGLLLGIAGGVGIVGSPLAGRLAACFSVRSLLISCHLLRFATLSLLVVCTRFDAALPVVTATYVADRAAKTLEMIFATQVAGAHGTAYRALTRTTSNAGYALGAGLAAIGLAVGTDDAFRVLVLSDALSFLLVAAMVFRTREPRVCDDEDSNRTGSIMANHQAGRSPWRDPGYLLFIVLDAPMNLDDSILNVGLPLWLVHRTAAPRAMIPAFIVINALVIVIAQIRVSARIQRPRQAAAAVAFNGLTILLSCVVVAMASAGGAWTASSVMLAAALLVTVAELMRSVSSWELAVSLAPPASHAAYLGAAGISQSVQKSIGPLVLTTAVLAGGRSGWILLGGAVAAVSLLQWRCCLRRLNLTGTAGTTDTDHGSYAKPASTTSRSPGR